MRSFLFYVKLLLAIAEGMVIEVQESGRLAFIASGNLQGLFDVEPFYGFLDR